MFRSPFTALVITVLVANVATSCQSGTANSLPGSVSKVGASAPPFDPKALSSRYIDRCIKDGGTVGQCQCQFAALQAQMSTDDLTKLVTTMEYGGDGAHDAALKRQSVAAGCP